MGTERKRRPNALRREFVVGGEASSRAPAEVVWDALADLRTHVIWAGERAGRNARLVTLEAPEGPAGVGVEFRSEGLDPMGRFADRSVVTEAIRPATFEFVTEARLTTKKGRVVDWTLVHRYVLSPDPTGCRIRYSVRTTRVTDTPGLLVVLKLPVVSAIVRRAMASAIGASVERLATFAAERAGATAA
jgi:hypothetical protein